MIFLSLLVSWTRSENFDFYEKLASSIKEIISVPSSVEPECESQLRLMAKFLQGNEISQWANNSE